MWLKDSPNFDRVVYVLLIVMYEGIGSSTNPDDDFLTNLRPSITEFQNGRHQFFLGYLSGPFYQNYVLVAIHGHLNPETTTVTGLDSVSE